MIAGWCPGLLRPMRAGDGLIVRLKIGGGIVDTGLASRIAAWSHQWGNGQIDLSGRGNLQLRGIADQHLEALRDAVAEAGLLDASAEGEAVRNVVSGPLAGLDRSAVLDVRPIACALEQRLSRDVALHGLPGKFGFVIDDGGALRLDDVAADIRFKALPGPNGPEFSIWLAGASREPGGVCRPDDLVDVAVRLSIAFLAARQGREASIRRMRDLVAADGIDAIRRSAGLGRDPASVCPRPQRDAGPCQPEQGARSHIVKPGSPKVFPGSTVAVPGSAVATPGSPSVVPGSPVAVPVSPVAVPVSPVAVPVSPVAVPGSPSVVPGFPLVVPQPIVILGLDPRILVASDLAAQRDATATLAPRPGDEDHANLTLLGVGLPFGRTSAADLSCLAAAASTAGAAELRLTPWRVILVPLPSPGAAQALAAALSHTTFMVDPGDPRLRVAACPGSPSCARGTTSVRRDAEVLAKFLGSSPTTDGPGIALHVSGCEKGCAHPRKAKVTLVARDGHYDLVRDGRASDSPVARDLTLDQAACLLTTQLEAGAA